MLPPRTEEEEKAIQMLQDYLDAADYTEGAEWTMTEEEARMFRIGWQRYCQEEFQ